MQNNEDVKAQWIMWPVVVAAIVLFAVQGLFSSSQKSASFDEQYHLSAGYAYLRTGDFRLATTHPPLIGMLAGAGVMGMDAIELPLEHPSWAAGDRFLFSDIFLWQANEQSVQMVEAARRPLVLVFGALLITVMFVWTRQFLGLAAAVMATVLASFEPNLVANARIVATDFGLTVLLFCAMWSLWRWLERPSWPNAALIGGFAGLAMVAKYTGVVFWPIALAVTVLYPLHQATGGWANRVRGLILAGFVAYATGWAVYSFDVGQVQVGGASIPVPMLFYWEHLWSTMMDLTVPQEPKLSFLLGNVSRQGSWYYFPVAIAVKTPVALLVMVATGSYVMYRERAWRTLSVLWLPPLVFLALGLTGILTIGFRHFLPAMPFLVMLASNSANMAIRAERLRRAYRYALAVLVFWAVTSALRVFPHQEAYFNELAGGWTNWSNLLVDSNLDWGQDLPALRTQMERMGIDRVNLAYFGKAVPEKYGVQYHPLPSYLRFVDGYELNAYNPYTPEPGWYAISATSLRLGMLSPETVDLYKYFQDLQPHGRAGYSIFLYNVGYPQELETERAVLTGTPVADVPPESLGIGQNTRVQAKWTRSGDSAIYPFDGPEPERSKTYVPVGAEFENVLELQGYESPAEPVKPGDELMLRVYWRRGDAQIPMPAPTHGRPLSAFVHLLGPDAEQIVAQYDGWETALRGLEPGDIIVQQMSLDLPPDIVAGEYRLIAGLYSPQSGQRLQTNDGGVSSDVVELGPVCIR